MIQRLLLDEAQASSLAISHARESGETRDEQESDSLASEFRDLLAQISGQMVSFTDQSAALGIALAQTQIVQRNTDIDRSSGDTPTESRDDSGKDQSDDDGADALDDPTGQTRLASSGNPSEKRQLDSNLTQDKSDDKPIINANYGQNSGDSGATGEPTDSDIAGIIAPHSSAESSLANLTENTGDNLLRLQSAGDSGHLDAVGTEVQSVVDQRVIAASNVEDIGDITLKKVETHEEDASSESDLGIPVESLTPESTQARDIVNGSRHNQGKEDQSNGWGEQSKPISGQEAVFKPNQNSRENDSHRGDKAQKSQDLAGAQLNNRGPEGLKKSLKEEADTAPSSLPETISAPINRHGDKHSEGMIQMTILRQAFESLRAMRGDGSEQRVKTQGASVQAMNANADVKANHGEGSSRSHKPLTRPQITRMLERVESTLKEAARSRDGKTISLRLEPVDLGRVKVDVSLREGTLHARITPENQQVVNAIREHAHELQGALRKLGLNVDTVSVAVTAEGFHEEMNTGQQMSDGRSFQEERHNLPQERRQVPENTIGNEIAHDTANREVRTQVGVGAKRLAAVKVSEHWVA